MRSFSIIWQISLLLVFLLSSCEESTNDNSDDPSNLSVEINLSEDNSGLVEITATAENAVLYQFDMGESGSNVISNETGSASYTYTIPGIYDIEVRAYGSSGRFLSQTEQVDVQLGNSGPISTEEGYLTPTSYDGMTLIWSDEFSGNSLNTSNWEYQNGNGCPNLCGWGNNELEYYRPENSWVENGVLTLEARKENYQGYNYTSTKLVTEGKFSFRYGRVDIRAVLPEGKGVWPALWMLPRDNVYGGWAASGEIDIMELIGHQPSTAYGTIHYGAQWPNNQHAGDSYTLASGKYSDEFHVFTLIWKEDLLEWYVDDNLYFSRTPSQLGSANWPFNEYFYLIFNVAVGGNWPGSPDSSTQFPQQMIIDYIRVFQESD